MSLELRRTMHRALVRALAERRRVSPGGTVVVGHHNSNRILPLGQPLALLLRAGSGRVLAKFRTPVETIEVVPRLWRRESEVVRAVRTRLPETPRCLVDFGVWSLNDYVTGRVLSRVIPQGTVGADRLAALAGFFVALADVPVSDLPALPDDWPADGDSLGFLRRPARFADERVYAANLPRFGALFDAVGVPPDAMDRFLGRVPGLSRGRSPCCTRTSTAPTSCSRRGRTATGSSSSTGNWPCTATRCTTWPPVSSGWNTTRPNGT
jgi:hypothetical protein